MFASLLVLGLTLGAPNPIIPESFVHPCTQDDETYSGYAAFTHSSTDANVLYWARGTSGLFQSSDSGATWEPMTPPHMCIPHLERFLTPQPEGANLWCVASELDDYSPTLMCSRNQGVTFDYAPFALQPGDSFDALIADATNPANMVARTRARRSGAQLWRTYDGGQTWRHWDVPGVDARDIALESLRPDGVVFAEICGSRPTGELCVITKITADDTPLVEYLAGPWKEYDDLRISADPLRAEHWLVASYVESSRTMFLLETFDDGKTYNRIRTSVVAVWGDFQFFADGGFGYAGIDVDAASETDEDAQYVMLRHGQSGDLHKIAAPRGMSMGWLSTAGNVAIFNVEAVSDERGEGGLFRLDESRGTRNAAWRNLETWSNR